MLNPIHRISACSQKVLNLFLLIVCCTYAVPQVMAQSNTYVRVSLHELPEEGVYAISGVDDHGIERFLSSMTMSSNRLKAVKLDVDAEKAMVQVGDDKYLWKLTYDATGQIMLYSQAKKMYLSRKENGKAGLILVSSVKKTCTWNATSLSSGALQLYDPTSSNRVLSISYQGENNVGFNNYTLGYLNPKGEEGLTLYRSTTYAPTGVNVLPQEGQMLCIGSASEVLTNSETMVPIADHLLSDGSIASMEHIASWTAEEVNASAQTFLLHGKNGFLSYDLTEVSEKTWWKIQDGAVCTLEKESRYLCYVKGTWMVLPKNEASSSLAQLHIVAAPPQIEINADKVETLHGGWTAQALSEVNFDDMLCLDLTHIHLPKQSLVFREQEGHNVPILVAEAESLYVPESWRFVVICGKSGNQLKDEQLQLMDKMPLFTPRPFLVKAGQIVYQRENVGISQWQTVSLPFPAKVVNGRVCQLGEQDFSFSSVSVLNRGEGYIALGDSATHRILIESQAGEVQIVEAESVLKGSFRAKQIPSTTIPIYLLHPVKQQFVRAAEGSTLPPFRAYLQTGAQSAESIRKLPMPDYR